MGWGGGGVGCGPASRGGGLHPGEGGLNPGGSTWGVCIQRGSGQTPPNRTQRACGTHPTGMHSCNLYDFTISGYGRFEFEHETF